jgi:hypothetical protein
MEFIAMSLRRIAVLVAAASCFAAKPASAVTFTFASFSYVGPARANYNNATGVITGIDIPINFNYVMGGINGTPATGFGSQSAKLSFTATRLGNVNSFFGVGFQHMQLNSFAITRTTPFNGQDNLLSGNVSESVLSGQLGGSAASQLGSVGAGATVFYASDFLTFPPATDADFSWALQSVFPSLSINGANFSTFHATVAGSFGYNLQPSAVPEAGSLTMLAIGLVPLGIMIRRKYALKA